MRAEEIRKLKVDNRYASADPIQVILRELTAQLSEIKEVLESIRIVINARA